MLPAEVTYLSSELLISNYDTGHEESELQCIRLRPYEARVYSLA
jgi:hypothetical protein